MTAPSADDPFQFDYRRHLAAQDLLPQHQEDFQRLVKLLCHAPRFQLLFARIADESYRRLLIDKLQDLLVAAGRPIQTADLSDEQQFPDFDALETWLESAGQGQAVIHLVNTGHWLQGARVQSLNLRRDALAEKLNATLLWWLSPDTLERVAREAPDAWSWRGGVFDFVAEGPGSAEGLPIRPRSSVEVRPLTLAQRSRRLSVLHQQLDGEGAAAIPDDLRLNLLLEQADLYESLGQWDLANQVLRQRALPLALLLGDERAKAVTQVRIADILQARGDLDDALRIRTEEALPVFESLGDECLKAVTRGRIADILQVRGELEEALRIRTEEELPVFKRLGDLREQAVTQGKIADILQTCGDLDGALRIRTEEQLPAYERLGDLRGKALTQGKIADILWARGDLDEALRIYTEEELPVYERLGDVHSKSVTQGYIADILQARGELDEALALHAQRLPIARQMSDIAVIAHIRFSMAGLRLQRGDHQTGGLQPIYEDLTESFGILRKLGRPDGIGVVGRWLAEVMAMRGQREEALAVLDTAEQAFAKIGRTAHVAEIRQLREMILGGGHGPLSAEASLPGAVRSSSRF
jgi:tetratricopeptide (TPR) repeat protein